MDLKRLALKKRLALNVTIISRSAEDWWCNKGHLQGVGQVLQAWIISQIPSNAKGSANSLVASLREATTQAQC